MSVSVRRRVHSSKVGNRLRQKCVGSSRQEWSSRGALAASPVRVRCELLRRRRHLKAELIRLRNKERRWMRVESGGIAKRSVLLPIARFRCAHMLFRSRLAARVRRITAVRRSARVVIALIRKRVIADRASRSRGSRLSVGSWLAVCPMLSHDRSRSSSAATGQIRAAFPWAFQGKKLQMQILCDIIARTEFRSQHAKLNQSQT